MEAYHDTILAVGAAVDSKGPYQQGHSLRVMEYALKAGSVLSFSPEEIETLEFAGLLHDVGKIMIDYPILNKTDELTSKEWEIMRHHPLKGAEMMDGIPILAKARKLVLYHHERYDGRGYPEGLRGEDIPIGARIIAAANEFDAMTIKSSFRNAMSIDDAVKELRENSGTQFCPVAVKALITGLRLNTGKK
jgi:HD-GYP domain-containing protein (c-di-GMP phosphodiesterase class II)